MVLVMVIGKLNSPKPFWIMILVSVVGIVCFHLSCLSLMIRCRVDVFTLVVYGGLIFVKRF